MPLTAHDILMDADAFRRCYPGWPLTSLQLTDYSDDPEFAIPLYGTCSRCGSALNVRTVNLGGGDHRAEIYCPGCERCACPCGCPAPGRSDDDGTPGWCDPCRMNIHQEAGQ
jgi:hypothetical protein